jgi:single-stranded-DNA-specific exonuclease
MPAANVVQLRARIDAFARQRLTLADFDPVLHIEAGLFLGDITQQLFQALRMLEPYGMGNPEPVFSTRGAQLTAPPRIMKEKHIKLKVRAGAARKEFADSSQEDSDELSAAAILATPQCHPDGAAIRRGEMATAVAEGHDPEQRAGFNPTFDALGWRMAEQLAQTPLLAGDLVDIAFTIVHNDHPEYGGLELSLRDFQRPTD